MPIATPGISIIDMGRRSMLEGISHQEATAALIAEYCAGHLFFRSGSPFIATAYNSARQVEIDGKPYAVWQDKCTRCGGAGGWQGWPMYTCFRCNGNRYEPKLTQERLYTAAEIERLDAIKAKKDAGRALKAAAAQAKADAELAARVAVLRSTESLYVDLEAEAEGDEFLTDILAKWPTADLTARQREAAVAAIARKRDRREQAAVARHMGTEGGKIAFAGKVVAVVNLGVDAYGNFRRLVRILTTDGCPLVWFTTSVAPTPGSTVNGTATVKAHQTYQDAPQTIITRPKFSN